MPDSNEEEVVVIATTPPTINHGMNNTPNTQDSIPLNESELLSSDNDDETDDHFGTRSRSSLDRSDETQK